MIAPNATIVISGITMSLWSVPVRTKRDFECAHGREIVLASDANDAVDQAAKSTSRGWIVNGSPRPYAAPGFAELPLLAWPERY